jgi:hypothetical protein
MASLIGRKAKTNTGKIVQIVSEPVSDGHSGVKIVIVDDKLQLDTIHVCFLQLLEPFLD